MVGYLIRRRLEETPAFTQVPTGPNVLITVSYRHAHQKPAEGTLTAGADVHIKNGTVLSVTATDKS
ncbi:hypothetical protein ACFYW9_36270 [Streptomyces sp. NPDC002698]|uniref:hypothetical protein n=1 Tax=Streptomyces sp. NPDC002698 TaxID=3364660 RepID=UPI00368376E6